MAKYKHSSYEQTKLIAISFKEQIKKGTFEYTLCDLIDNHFNLQQFESDYRNDEVGRPAWDPAVLLKIILYAYSQGITRSRKMAKMCEENVTFMAISADSRPHFTTLAKFMNGMEDKISELFKNVLLVCYELDLVDGKMFAIDGCKLPSNASKEWSGTFSDLEKKAKKIKGIIRKIVARHRESDKL